MKAPRTFLFRADVSRSPVARREAGSVLLLGLIVSMLLLLTVVAAVNMTLTLSKDSRFTLDHTRALSAAEGTTEWAQKSMLEKTANFETPDLTGTVTLAGIAHPFDITPLGASFAQTDADGVVRSIQHYRISSGVNTGDAWATVDRIVDLTMTPIFQFMIFYNDDLEILPGPNMTLGGRVHSNGDIYVGSGGTLRVDTEYFRSTGQILRKRKNDGTDSTGTVSIKVTGESTYESMDTAHDAELPTWTTFAIDTWKGTVQDGSHGVKEVAAPRIGTIKAFKEDGTKGYYHANADLVVVDGTAYDKGGNTITLPVGAVTQKQMYDAREGKTITITDINMSLVNSSGKFPANGLLYAYRTDASASQPNGVRLSNSQELLHPLTVVSEDPVYVKGDFNTTNKKGAAVICDSVNLLSKSWNDTKTSSSGLPTAADTTYNLAFITGNVPTPDGGGDYSGGFENLPRFHENWTNKTAKIRGSFIKIFESEMSRSPWKYGGNVYTAPTRDWAFDPDLNNLSNLPPFTPSAVYFQRVLWDDRVPLPFS
jgi:hypothetical protein